MSGKDLVKEAKEKGWRHDRTSGSHYIMEKDGNTVSIPVHSNRDLKAGILKALRKELELD